MIQDYINKLIGKPTPKPTPQPTPQPDPQPDTEHPEFVHTANGNAMWSEMKETARIIDFTFDASGFWSSNERSWPIIGGGNPQDGFICLIWKKDDKWHGEYWDCAVNMDYKYVSLRPHCLDPESPFAGRLPNNGDKVGNLFVSLDGTQRSNVAWGKWPL